MAKTIEELLKEALVPVEEQPYEVPRNWVWTKLLEGGAECLDKFRKPVNTSEREKRKGVIPYYGATGQVGWIDDYLTDDQLVLVGEDGAPFYELLKDKAYIIEGKAWINNHAHILKSYYGHNGNLYLLHYLNQFNYHGYVNGTTRLKLTQGKMKDIPFPLPPVQEQQRIVTSVESLFSKIDKAKELIEEAREDFENRKAAMLSKAFRGELTERWRRKNPEIQSKGLSIETVNAIDGECLEKLHELPKTWIWVQVEEIIHKMQTKKPSSIDKKYFHYIDIDSIDNKNQRVREIKIVEVSKAPSRASRYVEKWDVVISLVRPYLKNIALIEYEQEDMIASTGFYVCKAKAIYEPKLLYYYLKSDAFTNLLTSLMRGDNSPSVRISEFPKQPIPLPPLEEQKEIVRILDNLLSFESKIEELSGLEEQIELLKKSILSKAFRGELGTNDPTEESALDLLNEVLSSKLN